MNYDRQLMVSNWVRKAENDLKIGRGEMGTPDPATDMVCFHMQQCVEKYLKAYLTLQGREFRRTHDIAELIELCKDADPEFETLYSLQADHLTVYGVEIRYPDDFYMPSCEEAQHCVEIALAVRDFVREKLGMERAGKDR
ncbi:MAG TPA: HEPN domain-containing protein [Thermoflexia bacterium]|jgi:HEPN domain-containing protein|nr:HEPN domain-containing protein [Thermoflexia bacterium]